MAFTRAQIREAVEQAGDEHWQALIRHHEDAYPASRPTPGDVCRAEAERLNQLGLGDAEELTLVETRIERTDSTIRVVHVFEYGPQQGSPADGAVRGIRQASRLTKPFTHKGAGYGQREGDVDEGGADVGMVVAAARGPRIREATSGRHAAFR